MAQTLFEQNGGTYTQQGDSLLPDVKLPEQPKFEIGVWGNRRRQYLKHHHRISYYNMLTQCILYPHLADIEQTVQEMFLRLVDQLAEKESVTEEFKAENQMLWAEQMNNIRNRTIEVVNTELIYVIKCF